VGQLVVPPIVGVQLRVRMAARFARANAMTADRVSCNGLLGGISFIRC